MNASDQSLSSLLSRDSGRAQTGWTTLDRSSTAMRRMLRETKHLVSPGMDPDAVVDQAIDDLKEQLQRGNYTRQDGHSMGYLFCLLRTAARKLGRKAKQWRRYVQGEARPAAIHLLEE